MHLEANQISLFLGIALLVACNALLSGRRRLAALGSSLLGGSIGAVAYPLALCLFMGVAGAMARHDGHAWVRFQHTVSVYARASALDSAPRGAAMGVFLALAWNAWRRMQAHRRGALPS